MPISKITSRGLTTIPKPVREALQLQLEDRVEFVEEGGCIVSRRAGRDISQLDGLLADPTRDPVSLDDVEVAIQDGATRGAALF